MQKLFKEHNEKLLTWWMPRGPYSTTLMTASSPMNVQSSYFPTHRSAFITSTYLPTLKPNKKEQIGVKFSKKGTFMYFICFTVNR